MAYGQPNFYQYYGQNQYNPYIQQQPSYNMMQQPQPVPNSAMQPQISQYPMINGKIVENIETVKIQEIPLGGAGIFPQADGNKIYLKKYMNDGTTKIITFSPTTDDNEKQSSIDYTETLSNIQKQLEELDKKIDRFKSSAPVQKRKKIEEVVEDDE